MSYSAASGSDSRARDCARSLACSRPGDLVVHDHVAGPRAEQILSLAREIIQLEATLAARRRELDRLVSGVADRDAGVDSATKEPAQLPPAPGRPTVERRILALVEERKDSPFRAPEIAATLHVPLASVRTYLSKLVAKNLIERVDLGLFRSKGSR
jgi:hypothetical protein